MHKIGIIVAMDVEIDYLRAALKNPVHTHISGMDFYEGSLQGVPVVLACSGIGKVCAAMCAQTMILRFNPDSIIGGGIAGGLIKLPHGGLVIGDKMLQHDFILSAFGYEDGYLPSLKTVYISADTQMVKDMIGTALSLGIPYSVGPIASGDCFVNTSEKKEYITNTYQAVACEMEGAAIAQVCAMNEIPFCVIRCISDSADESANDDIESNEELASHGSAILILGYIKRISHEE